LKQRQLESASAEFRGFPNRFLFVTSFFDTMARGQMSKMAAKSGPKDGSIADLTPKQLKQQASMMRKSTPNALRRRFPQMKNMTDNEIMQVL
jgi:hypothetical protein